MGVPGGSSTSSYVVRKSDCSSYGRDADDEINHGHNDGVILTHLLQLTGIDRCSTSASRKTPSSSRATESSPWRGA